MRARGTVRRALLTATTLGMVGVFLAACTREVPAPQAAEATVVPLDEIDLSGVAAVRAPFCKALDPAALSAVLEGRPMRQASYGPGDRVKVTPGVRDVAHEYGCSYRRRGITARAWLFAAPVTRREARGYVAARREVRGCSPAGVLRFGSPGLVQACRPAPRAGPDGAPGGAAPGTHLVTMSGLFGSGYLTCQVGAIPMTRLSNDDLLTRAQRWCASVALTVGKP